MSYSAAENEKLKLYNTKLPLYFQDIISLSSCVERIFAPSRLIFQKIKHACSAAHSLSKISK